MKLSRRDTQLIDLKDRVKSIMNSESKEHLKKILTKNKPSVIIRKVKI